MKPIKEVVYLKEKRFWTIIDVDEDEYRIFEHFSQLMRSKYLWQSKWIVKVFRDNHYDGTEDIIFYQDNGIKCVFTFED